MAAGERKTASLETHGNFTDQKSRIVTKADLRRPWGGKKDGSRFRCYLCGHQFVEGDRYRWVYSNGTPHAGGNPMVCGGCDGPNEDVIRRWAAMRAEWRRMLNGAWWWFAQESGGGGA